MPLASLGNRVSSDGVNFRDRAYIEYTKALSATNTALMDPGTSKSDAVLAAVLLLGMFEVGSGFTCIFLFFRLFPCGFPMAG